MNEVSLFDEEYFHYFEEVDLINRLKQAGYEVGVACRAHTNHATGSSLSSRSAQALYYYVRNRIRFEVRQGAGILAVLVRLPWRTYIAPLQTIRHRDTRAVVATALAVFDALRGRLGRRDLLVRYREPLQWRWRDF